VNRGDAGYYKGVYLRSSYEYAYARYLDYMRISWLYEVEVFDVGFKLFKPDFFITDKYGDTVEIVEIKSKCQKEIDIAKKSLNIVSETYGIKCSLISYKELLVIYRALPFSLNSVIGQWINSEATTIRKSLKGELNGHYNMKHTEEAKIKIGKHTKALWASNGVAKVKMIEDLRKSGLSQKGKIKVERKVICCLKCGEEMEVLITTKKQYCSRHCSGAVAIKTATQAYVQHRKILHQQIKNHVESCSKANAPLVTSIPLNKISTFLKPLMDEIAQIYDVKDIRVITKAVLGKDQGRKALMLYLKEMAE